MAHIPSPSSSKGSAADFATMAGVFEKPVFEISVGNIFSWGDLHAGLSGYLKTLKQIVDDDVEAQVFQGLPGFCKELEVFLVDPESSKLDARNELKRWKEKADKMLGDEDDLSSLDIPELRIVEKK